MGATKFLLRVYMPCYRLALQGRYEGIGSKAGVVYTRGDTRYT